MLIAAVTTKLVSAAPLKIKLMSCSVIPNGYTIPA